MRSLSGRSPSASVNRTSSGGVRTIHIVGLVRFHGGTGVLTGRSIELRWIGQVLALPPEQRTQSLLTCGSSRALSPKRFLIASRIRPATARGANARTIWFQKFAAFPEYYDRSMRRRDSDPRRTRLLALEAAERRQSSRKLAR